MTLAGFNSEYYENALLDYFKTNYSEWSSNPKTVVDVQEWLVDQGQTAEEHYMSDGYSMGLSPNMYFDAGEYELAYAVYLGTLTETDDEGNETAMYADPAAAAAAALSGNAYEHYLEVGAALNVNPSNAFDDSDYAQALLDFLAANDANPDAWAEITVDMLQEVLPQFDMTPMTLYVDFADAFAANGFDQDPIAVSGDELVQGVAETYTLSNGVDVATANIFNAPRVWDVEGDDPKNSLNDDDVLTGTGENPTLNFTYVNDIDTGDWDIMPTLNDIETINIAFTNDDAQILDLQDATGVTTINASRIDDAEAASTVNIQAPLTSLSISNSNSPTSTYNATFVDSVLAGSADELALTLTNAQLAQLLIEGVNAAQGYEVINLESTGAANALAQMTTESIQSLIITGDQNLTIGSVANSAGSYTTVDASALEASLDYTIDAGIMGASPDGTSSGSVAFSLTGTVNNDTVRISDTVQVNDSLAVGDGDGDLLVMANSATTAFFENSATPQATGFEAIQVIRAVDGAAAADTLTVDLDQIEGDQTITLMNLETGAGAATFNLDNATAAEATAITILHSGATAAVNGDNEMDENIIDLDVADGVDTAGVTIAEGVNNVPRFSFTLTADSDGNNANATNSVSNITFTDVDSESNSVELTQYAMHTGTITVNSGVAGTYLNLDANGDSFGVDPDNFAVSNNTLSNTAVANQDSVFAAAYADTGYVSAAGAGYIYTDIDAGAAERIVASTIEASEFVGDLIVRVGEKNQDIATGSGDDTVIFDAVGVTDSSRLTAGLNISDKVAMGDGFDTIIIDGDVGATEVIGLDATEWTYLTGVDAIRLGTAGAGDYRLGISNKLVSQTDAGDRIVIINNDGDLTTAVNSDATINIRALDDSHFVDFYGANGDGGDESVNTLQVNEVTMSGASVLNGGDNNVVQTYTAADYVATVDGKPSSAYADLAWHVASGQMTIADAVIMAAADSVLDAGGAALNAADFVGVQNDANNNILEIYNDAEITVGDLANVSNFKTIRIMNDLGDAQLVNMTLTDAIVDSLVDASHASSSAQSETIKVAAVDNLTNGALSELNLQANTLTAKSNVHVLLGRGENVIETGDGDDVVVIAGNYVDGKYAVDPTTGFDMDEVANWIDDKDDDNDGLIDADQPGGTDADGLTPLVYDNTLSLGAGDNTVAFYGSLDLTTVNVNTNFKGVDAAIAYSEITINASLLAAIPSFTFAGDEEHTLTIIDDGGDLSDVNIILKGSGNLNITGTDLSGLYVVKADDATGNIIMNGEEVIPPVLETAVVDGDTITLTFDSVLAADAQPTLDTFAVTVGDDDVAVTARTVVDDMVVLTLAEAVVEGDEVSVSYTDPTNGNDLLAIQTQLNGYDADSFSTDVDNITLPPDTDAPTLESTTPADDATDVAVDANIVLTFNEDVQAGAGAFAIFDAADTTAPVATISAANAVFDGATVTLNPAADLDAGTDYFVRVQPTAVEDMAGNAFAGVMDATTFNFTTAAAASDGVEMVAGGTYEATADADIFVYDFTDMTGGNYGTLSMVGEDGTVTINNFDVANDIIRFVDSDGNPPAQGDFEANGYAVVPNGFDGETVVELIPYQGAAGDEAAVASDIVLAGIVVDAVTFEIA
ncbi:hypothetical protein MTBBW1_2200009 [Desulfamplus magnetovallimortis]|uniref:SbsA Ig-like domain-containing protein n=1 Tax=Desulfamplus magnetovallimortis TaxID=1246637 RepID=A0A1W1HDB0_9BACT|nr:Ig-like domain-containing protein [Desulfamplus magnetovallimortis]SLM30355.1 hypothetical protein MTBBW1_2200009 [Desulfamplus magnetovallimortis]